MELGLGIHICESDFGLRTSGFGLGTWDFGLRLVNSSPQFQSQLLDNFKRFKNIENLLGDHVGLPKVVIVTVHLVTWSG